MFLCEIAVDPACRRQGVGGAFLRELLAYFGSRNYEEMVVLTEDPENLAAHRRSASTGGVLETAGDRRCVDRRDERPKRSTIGSEDPPAGGPDVDRPPRS